MLKGLLDVIALRYLRDNESLALYAFIRWIREKYGVLLSSGTVYGRIYGMERSGLVRGESGEKKRVYLLTEKGEAALKSLLSDTPARAEFSPILTTFVNRKMFSCFHSGF